MGEPERASAIQGDTNRGTSSPCILRIGKIRHKQEKRE